MAKTSDEDRWRDLLTGHHRSALSRLPQNPRYSVCGVPFAGVGGALAHLVGYRPLNKNPTLCNVCYRSMPDGGIEVDVAIMFADFRGSTSMAEKMEPTAFAEILNRFYRIAIAVLSPRRAIIDKMIGDEVMAFFTQMGSYNHRAAAVESSLTYARFPEVMPGEKVPRLGIGVHAGPAFVGKVGDGEIQDFTALGDTINTAARLQAKAKAGEVILSQEIYPEIAAEYPDARQRSLRLRGREEPIAVRVLTPAIN